MIRYNTPVSGDYSVVESQTEHTIIGGLAPYTTYEFVVGYQSAGFAAPFSRKIEAMTMEGSKLKCYEINVRVLLCFILY